MALNGQKNARRKTQARFAFYCASKFAVLLWDIINVPQRVL